jgi:hypothetical protein
MSRHLPAAAASLILLLLLSSCATFSAREERGREEAPTGERSAAEGLNSVQKRLVEGAEKFVRTGNLEARGRSFRKDCTGTVLAIYWYAGIDLVSPLSRYTGNGVRRLYRFLEDLKLLYRPELPAPGDIIFWDDTYDRNEDGQANDAYTHAGMVVSVSGSGTVEYVHYNYRRGIVIERMNLLRPHVHTEKRGNEVVVVNSPMRMRGAPEYEKTLASELIRSFGKGYRIPRDLSSLREEGSRASPLHPR